MKPNFITPVAMECSQEQFEKDLRLPLEAMGILGRFSSRSKKPCDKYPILVIHHRGIENGTGYFFGVNHYLTTDDKSITVIPEYNPQLCLALAAMTEGCEPIDDEWMICIEDDHANSVKSFLSLAGMLKKVAGSDLAAKMWRKAKKEELVLYFTAKHSLLESDGCYPPVQIETDSKNAIRQARKTGWITYTNPERTPPLTIKMLQHHAVARIPHFKNKKGEPMHKTPFVTDWSITQWLGALTGEVGEFAGWNKSFDRGDITYEEFVEEAGKELADIQSYLVLLAERIGVSLEDVTREKFNSISDKIGSNIKL